MVTTHLPILAGLPLEEAVLPSKCLKIHSSTLKSLTESWMSKGFSSPNTRRRKLLTTSFKLMVSSPTEKKIVWREWDLWRTRCLRPLATLKPSRFLEMATDFRIPTSSKNSQTPHQIAPHPPNWINQWSSLEWNQRRWEMPLRILAWFEGPRFPFGFELGQN